MRTKRSFLFPQPVHLIIFCCIVFLSFFEPTVTFSEESDFYYYSDGRKIALPLSKEMLAVRFKPQVTLDEQRTIVESQGNLSSFSEQKEIPVPKITLLPLRQNITDETVIQTINSLNANEDIEFASPVFDFPDAKLTLTDEFIVKFDPNISDAEIESFNALNNVEIANKEKWVDWYVLKVKDPKNINALKMANLYYENPITEFAMPNFIRILKPMSVMPNDTYFPDQWHLSNTGQSGGTPDSDIDAPQGWEISTGSNDIVIAIIDEGVDLTHPDLVNKLVGGKDYVPPEDNDPSPKDNDAHGTACAGIAAAQTNNAIGVSGVAWGCKIMPVRVAYVGDFGEWITTDNQLALGIKWAADNGADVLSNSWGIGSPSSVILSEIRSAKNNGRNRKGCVIVFAAGNENSPVCYPAKYPEVIAVGATDEDDVRWSYSNYGPELDVVAPSGPISTHPRFKELIFWSTDITGSAGYNPGNTSEGDAAGNYNKWFGGTSAATPQVAGLAALILSVNPDLTSDEVQSIIQSTADDKGAIGRDDYYGYGRINIFNALASMSSLFLDKVDNISDDSGVVSGGEITYTISYANPITNPGDPTYIGNINNAVITDFLPDDLAFISASGPNNVYNHRTHSVTWNIGPLDAGAPNDSVTLTVKVNDCITGYGIIKNYCIIKGGNQVRGAREDTPVLCASHPRPTCGAIVDLYACDPNLHLSWCPGHFAAKVNGHEVYFGTNFNDVHDADNSWPIGGVYKGPVNNPSYPIQFSNLDVDTTYYWRIDEVNTNPPGVRWKGGIWSFKTWNYFVVEDFDEYDFGSNLLENVWKDWSVNYTGAAIYLHQGVDDANLVRPVGDKSSNSMMYNYRPYYMWQGTPYYTYYSEAYADTTGQDKLPSGIGSDWTAGGAESLSLWFYGQAGNDANEQMYVKLTDGNSVSAKVFYNGDMNDIRQPQWHQ